MMRRHRIRDVGEICRLLAALAVVLGLLSLAAVFGILVAPGGRNIDIRAAVRPATGESGGVQGTELPPEKGMDIPPVDPASLMKPSAELRARGAVLYAANCAACHGLQGRGDGSAAGTLQPRPRNLTHPDGWIHSPALPDIYRTLSEGISSAVPHSFDFLWRRDRMAVAHYVRSLGRFDGFSGDPEDDRALAEALSVSGEKTPNRIPVSRAMTRIEEEYRHAYPRRFHWPDTAGDRALLRRVLVNPARAEIVLQRSEYWQRSVGDFAATVLSNAQGNGFSPRAALLTSEEWKTLHQVLLRASDKK